MPVLSADFESELTGWVLSENAQIVTGDDGNSYALMNSGDSLLPSDAVDLGDLQFDARVNFQADTAGGLNIEFRDSQDSSYVLSVELTQTVLSHKGPGGLVPLTTVPAQRTLDTWYAIHLEAIGGEITLSVDGEIDLSFVDGTPLNSGNFGLLAGGETSFYLDDIVLSELILSDLITSPTLVPSYVLTEENGSKLPDALYQVLSLLESADEQGALDLAASTGIQVQDEDLNVEVIVWPTNPGNTGSIIPIIEAQQGTVTAIHEKNLNAVISLRKLVAVISADEVLAVRLPEVAASTSSSASESAAPAQQSGTLPASIDTIGWPDWNDAGITGSGVKIGVIDTSSGSHLNNVRNIIEKLAPDATITNYFATNPTAMASAVQSARNAGMKIILITVDLGAQVSPGDGTGSNDTGMGSADNLYAQIESARSEGRLVIASAGNNTGRYMSFHYTTRDTKVTLQADSGSFVINVSWDGWEAGNTDDVKSSISAPAGVSPQNSTARMSGGAPSYQYTGSCNNSGNPCTITVDFNKGTNPVGGYVQVQLNSGGSITGISGSGQDTTAGNLARPANSRYALAVGAICPKQNLPRYEAIVDSSHGPIFQNGGAGSGPETATGTRLDYKPDLVAPSHVYTDQSGDPDYNCSNFHQPTGGFNGTSASAAHVAAMAALLLSNSTMSAQIANASNPANAIQDYLQTHVIDLAGTASDGFSGDYGFDDVFGSGLTTLGDPNYDLSQVVNPVISGGGAIYVGVGNPGSIQDGSGDNPFVHVAKALAVANPGDRIVLMPGEYVTSFVVDGLTNVSLSGLNEGATFWVNDSYDGKGGILITNSTGITIEGFNFKSANPVDVSGIAYPFSSAPIVGVTFYSPSSVASAGGGTIRDSHFSNFLNDVPINVIRTTGVNIFDSTFENIDTTANLGNTSAIFVADSDSASERVLIQGNTFRNVVAPKQPADPQRSAVIRIENSRADMYTNFFNNTNAESVLTVSNTASDGSEAVDIVSNVFLNNANMALYMADAPQTQFTNNTVVRQVSNTDDHVIIYRNGGSETTPWAVHNNLFYDNHDNDITTLDYQVIDHTISSGFPLCRALDSAHSSINETGARNNWVIASQDSFSNGPCDKSFSVSGIAQNGNIIVNSLSTIPITDIFVGANPDYMIDADTDPLYYQLTNSAYVTTNVLDKGDPDVLAGFNPLIDFNGNPRAHDGDSSSTDEPEMGAFEITPLTASPINETRFEDVFNQVNDRVTAFAIDMTDGLDGGIPPFTFSIKSYPENFSTDTSDFCGGQGFVIVGKFAYYCPPKNFYTGSAPIPSNVVFEYYAYDRASDPQDPDTFVDNTITLQITPVADQPLTTPINTQLIGENGAPFIVHLRPFVTFNNFSFSEAKTSHNKQADYPFTYGTVISNFNATNPAMLNIGGAANQEDYINTQLAAAIDGTFTLQTNDGERGVIDFDFTVTNSSSPPSMVTNHVRLETVGSLPDRGIHDDASFEFQYGTLTPNATNSWEAITSPTNINHTLHRTRVQDDKASFDFVGSAFTAYMQGMGSGADWELRIDNLTGTLPALDWEVQPDGSATVDSPDYQCYTRAVIENGLISNNSKNLYTVTCSGLEQGVSHTVEFINRQASRWLAVDAFFIKFESDPLLPGMHDVDEPDVFTAFPGWDLIQDRSLSNGIGMATSSALVSDATFRFSGTGISIGTTLEGVYQGNGIYEGTNYDICITPRIGGVDGHEVCQNFDSGLGAKSKPVYNAFRSFFGYNYAPLSSSPDSQRVRIHINSMPAGGRLVLDSIRVLDQRPTAPLAPGDRIYEDDLVGPFVLENGIQDSWALNTRNRQASNSSLTSLARRVVAAGPFISFQITGDVDLIDWYRSAGRRDSQNIRVCVDRGQGETGINNPCQTYDLRSAPNPLVISELDFPDTWGTAWTSDNIHTVEIFSLTNDAFNFDKIEVFDSSAPLTSGLYEDYVLQGRNNAFGFFDAANALNGGSFQIVQDRSTSRASASSVARTDVENEGALFQMHGTGFTAFFTLDRYAGKIQVCWINSLVTNVTTVESGNNCRSYMNYSGRIQYQFGYSVFGLPEHDYTVAIRNLQAPDTLTNRMDLDAVQFFDDTLPSNILTGNGTRIETSFENRETDQNFLYYGDGWRSYSGSRARRYSGENYDQISRTPDAGLVFRVQDVDTLRIIRTARRGYADIEVCVDGTGACLAIPGDRDPATVHLAELVSGFDKSTAHVISLALTSSGNFLLDAIDLFDSSAALDPAQYEDDYPSLKYGLDWTNINSRSYSAGHGQYATKDQTEMLFHMNGSQFQIGAFMRLFGQMEVCYVQGIELDPAALDGQNCQDFPVNSGQSLGPRQVFNSGELSNGTDTYTVRIRNINPTGSTKYRLVVDYVLVLDGNGPLTPGRHEDDHPVLQAGFSGNWAPAEDRHASNGTYMQNQVANDFLQFEISGTGVGIGTFTGRSGSEMRLCYLPTSQTFDGGWDGNNETCLDFQNEDSRTNMTTVRSIAGLPDDTYLIGVVNVNNGTSELTDPPSARDIATNPPTLAVDFVEVYGTLPPVISDAGSHNEDSVDSGGDPFMQFLAADFWASFTGRSAPNATEDSMISVTGGGTRQSRIYAGQTALVQVELPPNSTSTFVLDTFTANRNNSSDLRYCVLEGNALLDCQEITMMPNQRYQTISLDNATGSTVDRSLFFSTLTPGMFTVDTYQFLPGDVLGAGVYEDSLFENSNAFQPTGSGWLSQANPRATERSQYQTIVADDFFQFVIHGTGVSIGTTIDRNGSEMLLCYVKNDGSFDLSWDGVGSEQCAITRMRMQKPAIPSAAALSACLKTIISSGSSIRTMARQKSTAQPGAIRQRW